MVRVDVFESWGCVWVMREELCETEARVKRLFTNSCFSAKAG